MAPAKQPDGPHPESDSRRSSPAPVHRIALALKVGYSAFLAVLVPVYWVNYGPTNFLYFCDAALLVTLLALWTESAYLTSMQALAITLPQSVWVIDFLSYAIFRRHVFDLTGYMFDGERSLFLRGLSFFHFWLPFLLLWLVRRLGYDRRAFVGQAIFGTAVLVASFVLAPLPIDPLVGNVNKIHGPSETTPQTFMDPHLWLLLVIVVTVLAINLPTHALLSWWTSRRRPARR